MSLKDKTIVVTGGSRGLGLGLVEALVGQGAKVTVVARDPAALAAVEQRLGVATISADVTDKGHAQRILADVRPEILVLNAGATPRMGRLDRLSWADFTATWETDVKAGLYWLQAALNLPHYHGRVSRRARARPLHSAQSLRHDRELRMRDFSNTRRARPFRCTGTTSRRSGTSSRANSLLPERSTALAR